MKERFINKLKKSELLTYICLSSVRMVIMFLGYMAIMRISSGVMYLSFVYCFAMFLLSLSYSKLVDYLKDNGVKC